MRVVITGAGGLVGGRVLDLLDGGHDVWAITRSPQRAPRAGVRWVTWDLAAGLPDALPDRVDVVIHLAQSPHYRDFPGQALDVFNVNVGSTVRLLDWARRAGVSRFVLASSGGVGAATPQNFYLATRQSAELLAGGFAAVFEVLILRFFFVYGPGQPAGMLVPRLVESVASGRAVTIAAPHGTELNPVHVDDAARALIRAIELQASGIVDIAGPETLTIRAMAEAIAARMGRQASFAVDTSRPAERVLGDVSRMRGFHAPVIQFADGVAELLGGGRS